MGQPQQPIAAEKQILSLGRFLQKLREEDNVDVLIATAISYLQEQFSYQLIWIALYDRLNHVLLGKGGLSTDKDISFLQQRLVLNPGDLLEQVVIEQRPLGVADLRAEHRAPEWHELADKNHIQGTIILPIRHQDRCLGIVLLGSERWGYLLTGEARARLLIVMGELGALLYRHEINSQQQPTKYSSAEPLLKLLENVRELSNLDQKLAAVVTATHQFVFPSRTAVYWFERQGRYFWCRMSNQLVNMGRDSQAQASAPGITVQELSEFYYALAVNQIVWIGESRSSLNSNFTAKLLQRLKVRSLLAAPIICQKDLLGFIAVEANKPRIWTDADKNFVQGAAGLISLVAPIESVETTITQIQADAQLTNQVAQAVYGEHNINETLHSCATKVLERLAATRFLLLQFHPDQNYYQIFYQSQPYNRRPLNFALNPLTEIDTQLLQRTTEAIEIENLDTDLRFFHWRSLFLGSSINSFLVCNCTQGKVPTTLLIVTHEAHHSSTTPEKELLWAVSQQIGVMMRQWEMQSSHGEQQKILRASQQCLHNLTQIRTGEGHLERTALKEIASILGCPLALLLTWSPGQHQVTIVPGVMAHHRFEINMDASISVQTEVLIHWALARDGHVTFNVDDLPLETKRWLSFSGIGQIFVMALRTHIHDESTGVVLMATDYECQWSQQSLSSTETLIRQLAWFRRQTHITQLLDSTTVELQQLNWYKHRRLEELQRTTALLISQIHDVGIPHTELAKTRHQLLLRQLDQTTNSLTGLLKLEKWQLHMSWETMPISSLLKRSLEKIENFLKPKKLWIGVHGLGQEVDEPESLRSGDDSKHISNLGYQNSIAIAGDIIKIELVIHELLVAACQRSHRGGRIDIWCRRLDERTLDLSITDNGVIESQLLTELNQTIPKDILAPSTLNQPPGLHLHICQNIMQQMRGELHFYQLPDHRVVSRLLLLLAEN
ncbi:GAF domain-containing protein [Fortiea contorta]|uniref:GAF domain-containing protein n=1 Tax=Fortiea contorta TaxID=1892405 RepID=UPI0003468465|nr:GAF domain-containing protein [Fortiea contorta]